MTLEVAMTARLDTSGIMASLTGSLDGSLGDLQSLDLGISVETSDGAVAAAAQIDLGPLNDVVARLLEDLGGVLDGLPVAGDLIGPIAAGIEALEAVLSTDFETDVTEAVNRIGAEFEALEGDSVLSGLRQLAEALSGSDALGAVQAALQTVAQLAGGGDRPAVSVMDLVTAVLTVLDTIGGLMTLQTMLAEAQRLGQLVQAQLPPGRFADLAAQSEALFAAAEAALDGVDTGSDAAMDQVIDTMVAARAGARSLIDAMTDGMAFAEATLTYADPAALVARSEAVLVQLRGAAIADVTAAVARLSDVIGPLFQLDMSGVPQFSLEDLLTRIEAQSAELATDIAGFDLSAVTDPLTGGLGSIAGLVDDLRKALEQVQVEMTDALGQVRDAVAALPIDQVLDTLRSVTDVIAGVLETLTDLLGGAEAAIGTAAGAAQAAITTVETALTAFRSAMDALFGEALDFVDGLGLDQVVGEVADGLQTIADVIGQADMAPYFATAQDAINTTADVIDKVPFALLPDEMEQELVTLIRPIKTADTQGFRDDIRDVLQINEDGSFALRGDLEAIVADLQGELDKLVAALATLDPQLLADQINAALDDVRAEVDGVVPAIALEPLTEALDQAKAVVAGLDLDGLLQPLSDGFDQVLAQVDAFTPTALIAPLDAQLDGLRQKLLDVTRLEQWQGELDALRAQALQLVAYGDPTLLEPLLQEAFEEVQQVLAAGEWPDALRPFGAIVSALMSGGGEVVMPDAIARVSVWLRGAAVGGDQLQALTAGLRDAIAAARTEVEALDPAALADRVAADSARLAAVIAALPAGPNRDRLARAAQALDVSGEVRLIAPNHARFAAFLAQSQTLAADLATRGFGEVDSVSLTLRASLTPLLPLFEAPRTALERMGFTRLDAGLAGILGQIFDVASPERLVALVLPIYRALYDRVAALLDAVLQPLRDMIDDLLGIVAVFDLGPLSTALDAIHAEIRADIAAFHPDTLLAEVKTAFAAGQAAVADFDPLGPVIETLDQLKASIARVLDLMDGDALLAVPIEVYNQIMALLEALNFNDLLTPIYDRLDAITAQVGAGLDGTVAAFEGLQEALPDQVGSTRIVVTLSAGGA